MSKKRTITMEEMMNADIAQAFRERPCKNCHQPADTHIHVTGTEDFYLCPTVSHFEDEDDETTNS